MSGPIPAIVTNGLVRDWALPPAEDGGDKHTRGTVVVLAGSVTTPGAALLAGLGALRVGAGRLKILTTRSTAVPLGLAVPEALVAGLPETGEGGIDPSAVEEISALASDAAAVLIGPGMVGPASVGELTSAVVAGLGADPPLVVLDAAALSSLDVTSSPLEGVRDRVVLTPNEGELATMAGVDADRLDVPATASSLARRLGAVVAVRGWIAAPDGRCWKHEAGTAGLGTSGSGDVKAGIVVGLAARGASAAQAGVWGAHVHARAGERLMARTGLGFLARELLDEIPAAMAEISC